MSLQECYNITVVLVICLPTVSTYSIKVNPLKKWTKNYKQVNQTKGAAKKKNRIIHNSLTQMLILDFK